MQCPTCGDQPLHASMTQQGVEVDHCQQCHGVWLDKGEIFFFTKRPKELAEAFQKAQKSAKSSPRLSPKTGKAMQEIVFLDGKLVLDVCPETEGIWFDEGEIERLVSADPKLLSLQIDRTVQEPDQKPLEPREAISEIRLFRLPNLTVRSAMTIILMYAPLFLLCLLLMYMAELSGVLVLILGVGVICAQWGSSFWLMDRSVRRFLPVQWIPVEEFPAHLQAFITHVCSTRGISLPVFGIFADGRPNIFTYGYSPRHARVIVTQGLLDGLSKEELEAVMARELGHSKRWDLLVMTVAYSIPWLFSLLAYSLMERVKRGKKRSFLMLLTTSVVYWCSRVTMWPILWLSRGRQISADRFAGEMTGNPNRLVSACIHIARGMAGMETQPDLRDKRPQQCAFFEVIGALGIMDVNMAKSFIVSAHNAGKPLKTPGNSAQINTGGALKWELWNPWARYYEWKATHPLLAKRFRYAMNHAQALGLKPEVHFSLQKPESYWNEFFVDGVVMFMPNVALLMFIMITLLTRQSALLGLGLIVTGILAMVKFFFTYPTELFPLMTVSSLFKHVKASGFRPVPCTLKGKIAERNTSGSVCADDIVMQDYTGLTFLEYQQPLRVWEFLFGVLRTKNGLTGEVTVEGWYRRSPVPNIEIKTVSAQDDIRQCYAYTIRKVFPLLVVLLGFALAFFPLESVLPFW